MTEHDFLDDRRRASEDDYFRKKDRELIEKMRAAAAADHMKSELSTKTGLSDPALLEELECARLHARHDQRPAARSHRRNGLGRGGNHAGGAHASHQVRPRTRDRGRQPRRSTALGLDVSTAVDRRLRARHAVDSRHARHGLAGRWKADGRRPHQVLGEHRLTRPAASSGLAKSRRRSARRSRRLSTRSSRGVRATGSAHPRHLAILAERSTCSRAAERSPSMPGAPQTPRPPTPLTASVLNTSRHRRSSGR